MRRKDRTRLKDRNLLRFRIISLFLIDCAAARRNMKFQGGRLKAFRLYIARALDNSSNFMRGFMNYLVIGFLVIDFFKSIDSVIIGSGLSLIFNAIEIFCRFLWGGWEFVNRI